MIPGPNEQAGDTIGGARQAAGLRLAAFWMRADAEGGKGCVATRQGRDERS